MNDEFLQNEPQIEGNELLQEIAPILRDYFEGDINVYSFGMIYRMPNGQKYVINAYRFRRAFENFDE